MTTHNHSPTRRQHRPLNGENSFALLCGIAALERPLVRSLEHGNLRHDQDATITLLVDLPRGFALQQLPVVQHVGVKTIVLSDNTCPEYGDDLWELNPAALLIGFRFDEALCDVVAQVARGERFRATNGRSRLTPGERALLRAVARGWSNERIAEHMSLEERSVRNGLTRVYRKLGLANRVQAALYYWGRADLFH